MARHLIKKLATGGRKRDKSTKQLQSAAKKPPSMTKRIRDVKRLLNKPGLDAAVRAAQERRLAELSQEQEEKRRAAKERKFAIRYHKIRFFERVKIERQLERLKRQQRSAVGGKAVALTTSQLDDLRRLEEDLQYVLHFPKGEKYVSLLRNADDPEAQAHLESERIRLHGLIRKQLAEAALVTEGDEGRSLAAKFPSNASAKDGQVGNKQTYQNIKQHTKMQQSEDEFHKQGDDFFLESGDEGTGGESLKASHSSQEDSEAAEEEKTESLPVAVAVDGTAGATTSGSEDSDSQSSQYESDDEDSQSEDAKATILHGATSDDDANRRGGELRNHHQFGVAQHSTKRRREHMQSRNELPYKERIRQGNGWEERKLRGKSDRDGKLNLLVGRSALKSAPRKSQPAGNARATAKKSFKVAVGSKRGSDSSKTEKQPLRTRAEGGRKRRSKK